ncbi:hypothetical protein ACFL5X_00995 [Candidatus Omnitrophota bacterium]
MPAELLKERTGRNLFVRNETVLLDTEEIDKTKINAALRQPSSFNTDDILLKRQKTYRIKHYAGSGLAGSVWKAVDLESKKEVALKIYDPRGLSGVIKKLIRNIAHLLAYQSPFPYRYIREAVLANAVVGDMLASVAEKEMGRPLVARTQTIFFETGHKSWGEVIDWVEGKSTFCGFAERKEVVSTLKRFRTLARKAGFTEHSYQVEDRLGGAAQTFRNVIKQDTGDFFWVDRTPAMPVMLFLYPYHLAAMVKVLRSRRIEPFFDKVDARKLKDYINHNDAHPEDLQRLELYRRLRREYEACRVNLPMRLASRTPQQWKVKETVIGHWQRSRDISTGAALRLRRRTPLFYAFALFDLIPGLGPLSRKLFLNTSTWRHLGLMLWPILGNTYRMSIWRDFSERSVRRVSAWLLEDVKKMYDKGKITLAELHQFEEATKTKEWLTYMWVLFWHAAGKIPGDLIAAGFGGYGLATFITMLRNDSFSFTPVLALGLTGMLLPGLYRLIITFWVAQKNPNVDFKWYWIAFCVLPTFGYLAMPLQILTQNLSNKAAFRLFYLKIRTNIADIVDIIPGYRELDFYVLSRIRGCR